MRLVLDKRIGQRKPAGGRGNRRRELARRAQRVVDAFVKIVADQIVRHLAVVTHDRDVVEEPEADDSTDRVERMVEQAPDPVVFMHDGEVVAALILMPGWSFHRPQMNLTREGRGQLIVKRRER